ncbi:MAG: hypothetical protein NTX64_17140 [Elusimicrobia bacterium]|nr:hypothetical protein [Elusimicrobiota bacterium]
MKARLQAVCAVAVVALALAACGGPSMSVKKHVTDLVVAEDYERASAYLEQIKQAEYGQKNAVIYYLDAATVLHHAGRYQESDADFDKAEKRMEELYTTSISKAAATLLVNDNMQDYSGEVFERALTNIFRALNYTLLGQTDEALVEARKVEVLLDEINRHRGKKNVYKDDAFARYLDSLLYEDAGQSDDARISREAAEKAYQWYASKYGTSAPDFDGPKRGAGDGEVVFIHYAGVGPMKVSKTFQVAWKDGLAAVHSATADTQDAATKQQVANALAAGAAGDSITVSYPEYVQQPFTIVDSEVQAADRAGPTILVEPIAAIAVKDLQDRMLSVRGRAIARATIKFLLAKVAGKEAQKKGDFAAILTQRLLAAAAAATEVADTRSWTTVPAQIRMARLAVAPGTHELTVRFKDASGAVVKTRAFKVVVKKGKRTYLAYRTAQ